MERKWWTLVVVCAATFMLLLDVTIVIVALPEIQSGLHSTFADVQWVIDAYAITLAALLLTAGSLADRYGRRLLFLIGLAVFTVGSALCGAAQSPLMLIALPEPPGRRRRHPLRARRWRCWPRRSMGRERGVAFGIWGAVTGVATSLGPVLGGVITTGISWRGIFLVNLPVGVVALAIAAYKVDESRQPHATRPDWVGFVVLTAGLVSLTYGLIRAGESSWSSTAVITCLCLGAVLLFVFVLAERRISHPMFDLSLFRIPTFLGGSIAAFTMNGSLFAMLVYLVLYLQDNLGYSALQTGLRLLLISGASLVFATISGRLSSQMPVRWLIGPGLFLVGIGLLLMAGLDRDEQLDALHPRLHRLGHRERAGQPTPGVHCGRGRRAGAVRHGVRHQHDVPPDRHCHRHRRLRVHLHGHHSQPSQPAAGVDAGASRCRDARHDRAAGGDDVVAHRRDAGVGSRLARRGHPLEFRGLDERPPGRERHRRPRRRGFGRDADPQPGLRRPHAGHAPSSPIRRPHRESRQAP